MGIIGNYVMRTLPHGAAGHQEGSRCWGTLVGDRTKGAVPGRRL